MDLNVKDIGNRLGGLISATEGMSMEKLGRMIGQLRGGYISRLVGGQIENPGIKTYQRICNAAGWDLQYLLFGSPPEKAEQGTPEGGEPAKIRM